MAAIEARIGICVMGGKIGKLVRNAQGATAIEYGLILALIVIAIITGVTVLGGATGTMWQNLTDKVVAAEP